LDLRCPVVAMSSVTKCMTGQHRGLPLAVIESVSAGTTPPRYQCARRSYRNSPLKLLSMDGSACYSGVYFVGQTGGEAMRSAQPFLRWAGSKRQIVPALARYWGVRFKRYVEPFAGSACLFFSLNPPSAILGDLNADLISTYLEIKYRLDGVLRELSLLHRSRREYNRLRAVNPGHLNRSARAARFIYLNRFCFNGIYRTNLKGEFNVPYGGQKSGNLPSTELFRECSKRLRRARLLACDFEVVLQCTKKGDLVYMDPPFAIRARRVFNEYDPRSFGTRDIVRLRSCMEKLDMRGISFVVSYAESDEANILRRGFDCRTVSVRRNIAGFASHRSDSSELLISNV
jgi:DNA adenine methylase